MHRQHHGENTRQLPELQLKSFRLSTTVQNEPTTTRMVLDSGTRCCLQLEDTVHGALSMEGGQPVAENRCHGFATLTNTELLPNFLLYISDQGLQLKVDHESESESEWEKLWTWANRLLHAEVNGCMTSGNLPSRWRHAVPFGTPGQWQVPFEEYGHYLYCPASRSSHHFTEHRTFSDNFRDHF